MVIIALWLGIQYDISSDSGEIRFLYHFEYSLAARLPGR